MAEDNKQAKPEETTATAAKTDKAAEEPKSSNSTTQPLAPPPKPSQSNGQQSSDYFSGNHHGQQQPNNSSTKANTNNSADGGSHFSLEPNPFEQSFGNPSSNVDTPGKFAGLPSVASLTSPAPLGPGGTPNWQNSLRSGPLSPAMLQGPANHNGYFDESFKNSYPTPNESSLRTGLTPGGGGSMFPAPSPGTQAIFNLQGGGATPGTLEFQRTAMSAAARSKMENSTSNANGTKSEYQPAQQSQGQQDAYNQPENDAVNSLYLLAQNGGRNANQFAASNQQGANQNYAGARGNGNLPPPGSSPTQHRGSKMSMGSTGYNEAENFDDDGDDKSGARGKGKKGNTSGGNTPSSNARRKASDAPGKAPPKKKARGSVGSIEDEEDFSDEDMGDKTDSPHSNKKMTDEEKRKNFLERNRVAALKCRQRKKQWLANLQNKVEIFTSENEALTTQCNQLREEIINLKTLFMAHKDCPVSHQQGLGGNAMVQFIGDFGNAAAYMGMSQVNQGMGMQGNQGMQRR